jgi:hypothetical protein
LTTPVVVSHFPITSSIGSSRSLIFGSFPAHFPSPSFGVEDFDTPIPPRVVPWSEPKTPETFPTLSFTTPPPVKVASFIERETYFPSSPVAFSSNPLLFPFPPGGSVPSSPVQATSPLGSPLAIIPMVGANPPRNKMDAIVAARYGPLILAQPMNALPAGDYLKYMHKFKGEEDITTKEHLVSFYSYADNLNIEREDVWMRVFVQSLDGEARKWFRGLTPGSIVGIEALDDVFLR